jgi:methionyl-tRNA formyltransferase
MKPRILFMGTPEFAVPSLNALCEAGLTPMAVVTAPDKPRGRGQRLSPTAVKAAALEHGIETILQPESVKDPEFAAKVRELRPDVIVVVAFRILPAAVFTAARLGAFNLHGSLLPRWRGAAPINRAIMAGDTETGVTTFFLKEQVDTGSIILKRRMSIGPDETAGSVHDRMMVLGAEAVVDTTRMILDGTAEAQPQDDALATPAPRIFPDDCRVDWTRTAAEVHNHIRGLSPYPGAWTMHDGTLLKLYLSRPCGTAASPIRKPDLVLAPGEVHVEDNRLLVGCADGPLELLEVQQAGKRRLPAQDFLNGYPVSSGDRLE